jgi:DNA (cytosine-5)-methyltransferase 1
MLAAQWMGWKNVAYCEIDEFCNKVTRYHFPNAKEHNDIRSTDFTIYRGQIDIVTGGFPCQPFSQAGKRKGTADERHLWPEMLRAIREVQPRYVVGENVSGITNWDGGVVFEQVCVDLEAEGYEVQPVILPACAVNAPHRRDRVWFVAHRTNIRHSVGANSGAERNGDILTGEQRGNKEIRGESRGYSGVTTNADISTKGSSGASSEIERIGSDNTNEPESGGRTPEQHIGCGQFLQDVADTKSEGSGSLQIGIQPKNTEHGSNGTVGDAPNTERPGSQVSEPGKQRKPILHAERNGTQDVANANGIGLRGQSNGLGNSGQFGENGAIPNWDNFPTVAPVCSQYDGISYDLDAITFSKWRKESIKGAGNAIVPQVAYEIFKALQQTIL